MNPFKHALLSAYYTASLPNRRRAAAGRAKIGAEPVSILFYHRVADAFPNGWTLPTRTFAKQVEWLARRFDVVPLAEAQRRIASGFNDRPTVAITFDDGYADNCEFALPLLLRKGLPFTYFVTTEQIRDGVPFPHDVAAGVRLRPNTVEEIRSLAGAGVEIGAHTQTHPSLGAVTDTQQLRDEIVGSKRELEAITGRPVRYFAFPFGLPENMSPTAFAIAYRSGFAGVCSAYGAYNLPGDDPFHLQRIHADPQTVRLKNWLSIDPRKLDVTPYDTGDYRQPPAEPAPTQAASTSPAPPPRPANGEERGAP